MFAGGNLRLVISFFFLLQAVDFKRYLTQKVELLDLDLCPTINY